MKHELDPADESSRQVIRAGDHGTMVCLVDRVAALSMVNVDVTAKVEEDDIDAGAFRPHS